MTRVSSSITDSPRGRLANRFTAPPLRTISKACACDSAVGAVAITTSAPSPPVAARTCSTASPADASNTSTFASRRAKVRRSGERCVRSTRNAPKALATSAFRQPSGPAPITTTVSPGFTPACCCALMTQLSGSESAAARSSTSRGTRMALPPRIASAGTSMNSANAPSKSMLMHFMFGHRFSSPRAQ